MANGARTGQQRGGKQTKFIFVTGGVVSSLGKGLASASIGALLENRGLKVTIQKLDPYINVDPGTMNPIQHGEVFVTDDGAETDLDLGHYERFITARMTRLNNFTTGQIYDRSSRRSGAATTSAAPCRSSRTSPTRSRRTSSSAPRATTCSSSRSAAPSVTSSRCRSSRRSASCASSRGRRTSSRVHLTLVPYIAAAGELKTKPTQHSVQKLREIGIQPDILICRCDRPLEAEPQEEDRALLQRRRRRGLHLAGRADRSTRCRCSLHDEGLDDKICELLNIWSRAPGLEGWQRIVDKVKPPTRRWSSASSASTST